MKCFLQLAALFTVISSALGAIKTETVEYKEGDVTLEGMLVYDDSVAALRPGILVVHQWMGLTDYERKRAQMLAQLGYVAFAADIYGKGIRPADPKAAGELAGRYKADRNLLRRRVRAGFDQLRKSPGVDAQKIGAIGYCFGGTTVLELARSGAEVAGIVSFHGGLSTPTPADAKKIKGKILACHGADDPFVPPAEVTAFQEEMREAKVDWQLIAYGNAVHSFTDANASNDNSKGAAYNENADKRSWLAMRDFFGELFTSKLP